MPPLRRLGFRFELRGARLRDPRVRRVLVLMLPVTLGLGLINFNLLVNSVLGSLVSPNAPRAIDAAFRIYMLPQGIFSVAIATVLFPALSRLAARRDFDGLRHLTGNGMRQVLLLLVPAAAATLALATPITRLIYQHGQFGPDDTELVSTALFWFSFSLPTSGVNLLLDPHVLLAAAAVDHDGASPPSTSRSTSPSRWRSTGRSGSPASSSARRRAAWP